MNPPKMTLKPKNAGYKERWVFFCDYFAYLLKFQIRALQDKNEELELTNEHLEKRLEKIRQARLKTWSSIL